MNLTTLPHTHRCHSEDMTLYVYKVKYVCFQSKTWTLGFFCVTFMIQKRKKSH